MPVEVNPKEISRASAYELWMHAPNPMVTFFKTLDVTNLVRLSRKRNLKFNMLMDYCIGKVASNVEEFHTLPVGEKLVRYDSIALNTIIRNKKGTVNSCDLMFSDDLAAFNKEYLTYTNEAAENCADRDLSADSMVIGTSAIIDTVIDGAVNMYSGFNNPFVIWGKYRKEFFRYYLPVSFQFHHTQMDGAHGGMVLENLQKEMIDLRNLL